MHKGFESWGGDVVLPGDMVKCNPNRTHAMLKLSNDQPIHLAFSREGRFHKMYGEIQQPCVAGTGLTQGPGSHRK